MQFRTRKLIKPEDLNPRQTVFGGRLLAWIDEECGIYAACQLETAAIVTKYMGDIDFVRPARCGQVLEFGVETAHVGKTSLTVRCVVREKASRETIMAVERMVFVALDKEGRPTLHRLANQAAA